MCSGNDGLAEVQGVGMFFGAAGSLVLSSRRP
jgi:hypothetical protein